jgi:putative two-component system response regulator
VNELTPGTVLVADDEPANLTLLSRQMHRLGYEVLTASNGRMALEALQGHRPDLVLLDVDMPELNGFEVCRRIKRNPETRLLPVILVTGRGESDDRVAGIDAGADDFVTKPFVIAELTARVRALMRLKQYTDQLDSAESLMLFLALTIEARDPYTHRHCERLADYAAALGTAVGLTQSQLTTLYRGAILHDVGKIGIPDAILLKPGRLTPTEFVTMQSHTIIGDRLCAQLRSLDDVRPIVRHHHERLDGGGYPDKLRGDDIPLLAQIMNIVDAFDAMTTNRPYRAAMPMDKALAELRSDAINGHKDRELVDLFIKTQEERPAPERALGSE